MEGRVQVVVQEIMSQLSTTITIKRWSCTTLHCRENFYYNHQTRLRMIITTTKLMNWLSWLIFSPFIVTKASCKIVIGECSHNTTLSIHLEICVCCKIEWYSPLCIKATNIMSMHEENQKLGSTFILLCLIMSIHYW